ncbi:hypothetical protein [Nitrosomonas ureae]|uniref:Uncharacterized protein n=1 Tax=Nitrosomonas ureae TaxID=44577 RepID=A0A1H5Y9M1_9PROT|nr:hypothetical protein [Nitrosomonas ureae]SEG20743.1 hypothetical protein SAMN05216334_1439 [Nitrosomonas ureae]
MLSLKEISEALEGVSRNHALKLLTDCGIRHKILLSRNGKKIYYAITREQIQEGALKEKDPKQIAIQQSIALVMLETALNRH